MISTPERTAVVVVLTVLEPSPSVLLCTSIDCSFAISARALFEAVLAASAGFLIPATIPTPNRSSVLPVLSIQLPFFSHEGSRPLGASFCGSPAAALARSLESLSNCSRYAKSSADRLTAASAENCQSAGGGGLSAARAGQGKAALSSGLL